MDQAVIKSNNVCGSYSKINIGVVHYAVEFFSGQAV